jgi:hypothetical protein
MELRAAGSGRGVRVWGEPQARAQQRHCSQPGQASQPASEPASEAQAGAAQRMIPKLYTSQAGLSWPLVSSSGGMCVTVP